MLIADAYSFLRKTAVAAERPIPVEEAKAALRIPHSFEDEVLENKLDAAEELIEARTTRVLRPCDFELSLKGHVGPVELKVAPIRDVTSVEYRTLAGAWVLAGANEYEFLPSVGGGLVVFLSSAAPPEYDSERANLRIKFAAGYGDAGEADAVDPELVLPRRVRELILLLAGHWFEHREAVTSGDLAEIPLGAKLLFEELRHFR